MVRTEKKGLNYAITATPEQALRSHRAKLPARVIAALDANPSIRELKMEDNNELPPEAGTITDNRFDPNDDWLSGAPRELQIEAMRRWFLDRFEEPANETPWDGEEKEYLFIWGGPYDPDEEIQNRFGEVVDYEVMEELITDLWSEVGDKWAPVRPDVEDYDDFLMHLIVKGRDDPKYFLEQRLDQLQEMIDEQIALTSHRQLLHQMIHGAVISALEAYLYDTTLYWVEADSNCLRKFVTTNKDLQVRSLTLAELFERSENIKDEVKKYLGEFIWHRLDKIKPMLMTALEIQFPQIDEVMKQVRVRHNIVHRAGRNEDGSPVDLSRDEITKIIRTVRDFSQELNSKIRAQYPS